MIKITHTEVSVYVQNPVAAITDRRTWVVNDRIVIARTVLGMSDRALLTRTSGRAATSRAISVAVAWLVAQSGAQP